MRMQLDMLGLVDRYEALSKCGDPLEKLNRIIEWKIFEKIIRKALEKERKSAAGRKGFNSLVMFKILILQALYNLSDGQMEYQLKDRLSFMRFLDLGLSEATPDEKTIWAFREQLKRLEVLDELFDCFDAYMSSTGFQASIGQMIDAKIVEVPKQRNSREENAAIKEGKNPETFAENPHKACQKDMEARWTMKGGKTHYGFKNHVNADVKFKIIRAYCVTPANHHDSKALEEILLPATEGQERVWADSAYFSETTEKRLNESGHQSRIIRRYKTHLPMGSDRAREDRRRSKVRKRVEHVFGFMVNTMRGGLIRGIGLARAKFNIGLRNLVYNLCRYEQLLRIGVS